MTCSSHQRSFINFFVICEQKVGRHRASFHAYEQSDPRQCYCRSHSKSATQSENERETPQLKGQPLFVLLRSEPVLLGLPYNLVRMGVATDFCTYSCIVLYELPFHPEFMSYRNLRVQRVGQERNTLSTRWQAQHQHLRSALSYVSLWVASVRVLVISNCVPSWKHAFFIVKSFDQILEMIYTTKGVLKTLRPFALLKYCMSRNSLRPRKFPKLVDFYHFVKNWEIFTTQILVLAMFVCALEFFLTERDNVCTVDRFSLHKQKQPKQRKRTIAQKKQRNAQKKQSMIFV